MAFAQGCHRHCLLPQRAQSGARQAAWPQTEQGRRPQQRGYAIASIVAVQGMMLGLLAAAAGHAALYFGLWILPALTLLPLFGRIRAIPEHAGYRASEDQRFSARTVVRPSWQTFFVGPHRIHYHIEHHEYPPRALLSPAAGARADGATRPPAGGQLVSIIWTGAQRRQPTQAN